MNYREERDGVISEWWKFVDEFTVHQAALLIVGVEPNSETGSYCRNWQQHEQPDGYAILLQALSAVLANGALDGKHIPRFEHDIKGNECGEIAGSTDVERSIVKRDSVVSWLANRGHRSGFFFPNAGAGTPDYLNPTHPRYSGKLAAAVSAWQAVTDPGGKHPKQALEKWLNEHSGRFGMTGEDGMPIKQAVTDCAKVANWEPGGGAPKTPAKANLPTPKR
jgi:hypothetical protein